MRRAAELSPADWPRVVNGVRWDGRGRALVLAAGLIVALLGSLFLVSSAFARESKKLPVVVTGTARPPRSRPPAGRSRTACA